MFRRGPSNFLVILTTITRVKNKYIIKMDVIIRELLIYILEKKWEAFINKRGIDGFCKKKKLGIVIIIIINNKIFVIKVL